MTPAAFEHNEGIGTDKRQETARCVGLYEGPYWDEALIIVAGLFGSGWLCVLING
jgi:hypothetical protein